jgi:hypothetical protein
MQLNKAGVGKKCHVFLELSGLPSERQTKAKLIVYSSLQMPHKWNEAKQGQPRQKKSDAAAASCFLNYPAFPLKGVSVDMNQ